MRDSSVRWGGVGLAGLMGVLAVSCPRASDDGPANPSAPMPSPPRRVGNQARGIDAQPDYEATARSLRDRTAEAVTRALFGADREACPAMVESALELYTAREGADAAAVTLLQSVRDADTEACVAALSAAAATCVRLMLEEGEGEYPWWIDQCARAYPREPDAPGPAASVAEPPQEPASRGPLHLAFVGDVIFGRYRETGYDAIPDGEFDLFSEVAPLLEADLLIGNLETPLLAEIPEKSPIGARFQFGAKAEHARLLTDAGFSAMSLANNHWFDLRAEGADATPALLHDAGLVPLGGARRDPPFVRVETLEHEGWTIAVLAVTARTNAPIREGLPQTPYLATDAIAGELGPLLDQARTTHDVSVVLVHWGDEYVDEPNMSQQRAARKVLDAGADLVIGHHPHVLQGIQRRGRGLVAYSLGNFVFENTHEIPRMTGVLHVTFDEDACLREARFRPAYIKRLPVPHPVQARGGMARRVKDRLRATSGTFATQWQEDGDDLLVGLEPCSSAVPDVVGEPPQVAPQLRVDEPGPSAVPDVVGEPSQAGPDVVGEPSQAVPDVVGEPSQAVPDVVGEPSQAVPDVVGEPSSRLCGAELAADACSPPSTDLESPGAQGS